MREADRIMDAMDPSTPVFHETQAWLAKQGQTLANPAALPEPSIGVQIMDLQRAVAIKTPTQLMAVISSGQE